MEKIILASGSSRRKEILKKLHFPFRVIIPDIQEEKINEPDIEHLVRILAEEKVKKAVKMLKNRDFKWVLGVDTLVTLNNQPFGKPQNREDAEVMLNKLSGNVHKVISGIALLPRPGTQVQSKTAISEVKFKNLLKEEIDYYIETGEWEGAAGAYKIQERASFFIEWIKGSYSNIVGLPISVFYGMLRENDYNFKQ